MERWEEVVSTNIRAVEEDATSSLTSWKLPQKGLEWRGIVSPFVGKQANDHG